MQQRTLGVDGLVVSAMGYRCMGLEGVYGPGDRPPGIDEILMRLLRSGIGPRVALLGQQESGVQRVTKAVTWMRAHFAQPPHL